MKNISLFLILFLSTLSCTKTNNNFWPEEKSPEKIAHLVTEDLLSRQDFMMYETPDVRGVHYAEVCTAYGATLMAGFEKDIATLERLVSRYEKVFLDSIENTANHVDVNVYGLLSLELFGQTSSGEFLRQGMELADIQWQDTLPNGLTSQARFWIDDIWMIGSLQTQAYRATAEKNYLDRAAKVIVAYLDKLQQPNGLFFHGEHGPFHWGRGNGWVAAGIAHVLTELPADHQHYPKISEGYKKMMAALLEYQSEDGMWRQLIDNETAWKETSCTGMFGYAMIVGVKKGILPEKDYKESYQKAWLSLTDYLQEDGKLTEVCVGTGQSTDVNFYLERPRVTGDFHGQAPLLWFAYELITNP
ncbi:MAG: glycosyl hydrolase [Bacteroidetes bacterium]|nr:MAG: glycosyl hydrolase [Bacteroidota bacterium]